MPENPTRRHLLQAGLALTSSCCLADMALSAPNAGQSTATGANPGDTAWLRSAENPYGPPESARRAIVASMSEGNLYPRAKVNEFKELVARDLGLTPEHVIVGAGSIELMLCAGLYYGKLGKRVVSADPTWDTTVEYAEANGAAWTKVPLKEDLHHDFDRMRDEVTDDVALVYICHPNNPTGLAEPADELARFVRAVAERTHVMVDEAFLECLENAEERSLKHLVRTNPNVLVSRTFSKQWGMAGLRVGYMLGDPKLLAEFKKMIPYLEMQSRMSVAGAIAAYADQAFIDESRQRLGKSRQMVYDILKRLERPYIPSDVNFVTFEVPRDAEQVRLEMLERGVAVKNVTFGGKQRLRVSCGSPESLVKFEQVLAALL